MTTHEARPELSVDELATWARLATVLEWLPAALDAQLQRSAQITHFEYGLLYALAQAPDHTLRMSVLAGYANSTLPRLSRAATRLEGRGWMRREPDPSDGRFTLAILTDDGLGAVEDATPGHAELVRSLVLGQLTKAQSRQLQEICGRIIRAMGGDGGWNPPPGTAPPG